MLEWISVYWLSRAGPAASTRIYYELTGGMTHDTDKDTVWTSVPLGVSYFPKEIFQLPKSYVSTGSSIRLNLDSYTPPCTDGHTHSGSSSSNLTMRREATSRRSSSPRRLLEIFARCLGREVRRTALCSAREDTELLSTDD